MSSSSKEVLLVLPGWDILSIMDGAAAGEINLIWRQLLVSTIQLEGKEGVARKIILYNLERREGRGAARVCLGGQFLFVLLLPLKETINILFFMILLT